MATQAQTQQQTQTPPAAPRPTEPAEWAQHDADLENSADLERWENDRAEGIR